MKRGDSINDYKDGKDPTHKYVEDGYEMIQEGSAKMYFPTSSSTSSSSPTHGNNTNNNNNNKSVFYNPVQIQNRDLSVLMISLFAERFLKRQILKIKKKEITQNILINTSCAKKEEEEIQKSHDGHIHPVHPKEEQQQQQQLQQEDSTAVHQSHVHAHLNKEEMDNLQKQLQEFQSTADWSQLIPHYMNHSAQQEGGGYDRYGGITGINILDALAASGLRSIRYWKEIPFVHSITINDLDPAAIDLAKENITLNQLEHVLKTVKTQSHSSSNPSSSSYGIQLQVGDATQEMYNSRRLPHVPSSSSTTSSQQQQQEQQVKNPYHVIDLDPYGSAAIFLDAAIQAVVDGGLLAITCTDMRALGGANSEICFKRYSSIPLSKSCYLQEFALRILLHSVATTAAKYGKSIKPILSVGMHFYIRIFVEIWDDKSVLNDLPLSIGMIYQSTQCPSFHIVPYAQKVKNKNTWQPTRISPSLAMCQETGGCFKLAGPIWLGPLHDQGVVLEAIERLEKMNHPHSHQGPQMLATHRNMFGLLTVVSEELQDIPLYYTLPTICKTLSCTSPPMNIIRAALINGGYRVSSYHKEPDAIKTDAPNHVLWDIFRCWIKKVHAADGDVSRKSKNEKMKKKRKTKDLLNADGDIIMDEEDLDDEKDCSISTRDKILSIEPKFIADFTIPDMLKQSKKRVLRFPPNPEPNWGPKPKAVGYKHMKKSDH